MWRLEGRAKWEKHFAMLFLQKVMREKERKSVKTNKTLDLPRRSTANVVVENVLSTSDVHSWNEDSGVPPGNRTSIVSD